MIEVTLDSNALRHNYISSISSRDYISVLHPNDLIPTPFSLRRHTSGFPSTSLWTRSVYDHVCLVDSLLPDYGPNLGSTHCMREYARVSTSINVVDNHHSHKYKINLFDHFQVLWCDVSYSLMVTIQSIGLSSSSAKSRSITTKWKLTCSDHLEKFNPLNTTIEQACEWSGIRQLIYKCS